ncbi:helix-turn-helix domain-containing protein [Eggerthellaceae bacterium zg-893]|nr:helix-turn-helix domain-containing protein [Eggerthellaceae bacterium zg-893]
MEPLRLPRPGGLLSLPRKPIGKEKRMDGAEKRRRPLAYDDRAAIERGLNRGDTVSWIARTIGRAPKVVREEIRRNWTDDPRGRLVVQSRNICAKYAGCEVRRLCKTACMATCKKCRDWLCSRLCPDFEARPCPRLDRTPFCCNACPERVGRGCGRPYRFYEAACAQDLADARRRDARAGIDCDPEAFERAIEVIKDGLAKGQSPAHIIAANPDEVPFGARSLHDCLGGAKLGALSKMDLPRAVRYKPRSKAADGGKSPQVPRAALEGRRWSDFCALDAADRDNAVEMDTVVGRQGKDRQCVLTLLVRRIGFQFYILLPDRSAESVAAALDTLQELCGARFSKMFGVVLADRGSEFADAERIEHGRNGRPRLRLCCCDPRQSQQKGRAERSHEELRRVLPKGKTDFDALTGRDMAACMSHVNSYMRGSMGWASPMDLARALFPKGLLDAYGVEPVDPRELARIQSTTDGRRSACRHYFT